MISIEVRVLEREGGSEKEVRGEEWLFGSEIARSILFKAELRNLWIEKLRDLLDYLILRLLRDKPMHGYGVLCTIRDRYGYYPAPSNIYPILSSFEKKIIEGLRSGHSVIEVAKQCGKHRVTIYRHIDSIKEKLTQSLGGELVGEFRIPTPS